MLRIAVVDHEKEQRSRQLVLIFITNMVQFAVEGYEAGSFGPSASTSLCSGTLPSKPTATPFTRPCSISSPGW